MSRLIDLTGQRFSRLTVISRAENGKSGLARWYCDCDCDCGSSNIIVIGNHLRSGHTQSCGCLHNEIFGEITSKHKKSRTRLCKIWYGMKCRTQKTNRKDSKYYSEKGIKLCAEWENDFEAFHKWSYNNGYADNLSIDRIDNNEGYSPQNCRWANHKAQAII